MAYNRAFNPDALPAFAEPERKTPSANSSSQSVPGSYPAVGTAQQGGSNHNYNSKPPPPLPTEVRHNSYGSSGGRDSRDSVRDSVRDRLENRDNRDQGYRADAQRPQSGPVSQPQGNYAYSNASSPPPRGDGRFPSGSAGLGTAAPAPSRQGAPRPPPSPAPGNNADPSLLPLFRAVDKDGSGQLSEKELGAALVNGDWSSFDPYTVRLMIRMFDTDRDGTIGFDEFCGLWSFLASWRTLFDRFDADRSGNISIDEFSNALNAFGYRLGEGFVRYLFGVYDKERKGALSFDLFVQSCISLKRMTDVFKKYDDDRDGYITLSFEDFLTEILRQQ